MTAALALADERSGPLVSPFLILLLGLLFVAALALSSRGRVRERLPWLLPEAAVLAVLSLLHLLFFWQPYRSGARVPKGGGDLASFFYPMHAFAAREIQDGRLPYWNPHLFAGAPHLANFQTATLYPPNLIAYLAARPFDYASLEQLVLLHYLLASWGVYLLARVLGVGRPGSVLAGAIFAYSGFLVAHLGHYSMLATVAWMPLVYAAIVATVRRGSWPAALGGALALASAVLGGHQPILLMSLVVALALAAFELWRRFLSPLPVVVRGADERTDWAATARASFAGLRSGGEAGPILLRLGFVAVTALLLALPVLGPSFEQTQRTVRDGLSYDEASAFSIEPTALVHMVTPTVFGSNPTNYWGPFSNTEVWGYAGVLSLFLAAFAVAARRSRTRVFWLLVAAAAVLYAIGPYASLHGWFYAFFPGFDRVRAAGRALLFVDLAVALLAGFGLAALLRGGEGWTTRERAALKWGLLALGGALGVVVLFVIPLMTARILSVNDPGNRPVIALDNLVRLALWLALGLGVGVAAWRGALRGGTLAVAVFVVVLLDLFHATAPFNPTTDRLLAGYDHPDTVTFLREREEADRPFRIEVVTPRWQPDLALAAGLDDIGGLYDPLGLADYDAYHARALADRTSEAYLNLNVRYIVSDTDLGQPAAGYDEVFRAADGIVVWEAPSWRPRAWIDGSDASVAVRIPSPASMVIVLPEGASGRLIVSQANYPGWRAKIDGRDTAIDTYDGALQSIDLPSGAHEVRLEFRPSHWGGWLALGAAGLLLWAGVAVWWWRNGWRAGRVAVSSETSCEGATA